MTMTPLVWAVRGDASIAASATISLTCAARSDGEAGAQFRPAACVPELRLRPLARDRFVTPVAIGPR